MTHRRDSTTGVMIFYRNFCRLLIFNLALANNIPSFSSIFQPSKNNRKDKKQGGGGMGGKGDWDPLNDGSQ
jgi:hypothetical protein